jgi:hypothetical protein
MITDHPEQPWKVARKRKVSSKDAQTETQKPAKKQKSSKPISFEVLKEIAELDTSEVLPTRTRKGAYQKASSAQGSNKP